MLKTNDKHAIGARLRSLREKHDLSMRELALRAGVAVSFLSKIEAGKTSPTIMSLVKILEALGIGVAEFFSEPNPDSVFPVVFPRAAMRALEQSDRTWWYAFPGRADVKIDLMHEEYAAATRVLEEESHRTDVCGIVLSGTLTLDLPGRARLHARKGDAFYIPAGQPHVSRNEGPGKLVMVVVQLR